MSHVEKLVVSKIWKWYLWLRQLLAIVNEARQEVNFIVITVDVLLFITNKM